MRSTERDEPRSTNAVMQTLVAVSLITVMGLGARLPQATDTPVTRTETRASAPLPPELPVEINARVQKWIERFLGPQRASFESYLSRESLFGPVIRERLRARGMPEELRYLAMIESGFSAGATSRVGAGGLWQFMSPTARQYGLRVDEWIDERRDPLKATDAALDYLAWLHDRYGSWYLAAAAYNAGPGRVDRALERHGGGAAADADLYWEIIDRLPRETREYVPKLIAATLLARGAEGHGFDVRPYDAYAYDEVWVPGGVPLVRIARRGNVDVSLLRDLNPHLTRGVTPPGAPFGLRIPVGAVPQVIEGLGRPGPVAADD